MKLSLSAHDQELEEIEKRIALERLTLDQAVTGCTNNLRESVASPKTLLALAGVGFVIGKLMFGKKSPPPPQVVTPKKAGLLGLLTGVAGSVVSSMVQPALSGTIARWAAQKAFGTKPLRADATVRHPLTPTNTVAPAATATRRSAVVS
jgi:hypothetical protein